MRKVSLCLTLLFVILLAGCAACKCARCRASSVSSTRVPEGGSCGVPGTKTDVSGGGGSCRQNIEDVLAVERRKNLDSLLKSGVITEVEYQNEIEKGMK